MQKIIRTLSVAAIAVVTLVAVRTTGAEVMTFPDDYAKNRMPSLAGRFKAGRAAAVDRQDLGTYASNIWKTVSSYIPYFEKYATNNYRAARLANYRAKRLEYWQQDVSNQLLLANAPADGLRQSAYFTVTNAQLASTVSNLVVPVVASAMTNAVTSGYVCTPREASCMANSAMEGKLRGRVFDLSNSKGLYIAVSNIISAMGGSVTNFPSL